MSILKRHTHAGEIMARRQNASLNKIFVDSELKYACEVFSIEQLFFASSEITTTTTN